MPRLENWEVVGKCLSGQIYDDDRFNNGAVIWTSTIVTLDIENKIVETKNTKYELGEPDPKFVQWINEGGHSLLDYEV